MELETPRRRPATITIPDSFQFLPGRPSGPAWTNGWQRLPEAIPTVRWACQREMAGTLHGPIPAFRCPNRKCCRFPLRQNSMSALATRGSRPESNRGNKAGFSLPRPFRRPAPMVCWPCGSRPWRSGRLQSWGGRGSLRGTACNRPHPLGFLHSPGWTGLWAKCAG